MTRPDPADESKLIDLRQLGALIGPKASIALPREPHSAVALPSFGGNQLRTSPRPLVEQPQYLPPAPPPAIAHPRPSSDTTVLLVMICGLAFVVLGLTFYVVLVQAPGTVVHETITVAAAPALAPEPEPDPEPKTAPPAADEATAAEPAAEDAAVEEEAIDEAAPTDAELATPESNATPQRTGRSRDRDRDRERGAKPTLPVATPKPNKPDQAATKSSAELSPECIIDPASCGLGTKSGKPEPVTKPKPSTDKEEALPKKLSQAQVRDGIASVKSAAKNCRAKHGGAVGESVVVKLTIQGSTGRVTSAAPVAPHLGTPLGGCVAGALKQATFSRFDAAVQGVQYGVRL